jgi:diguanylate cyclase (GGDEF)-like protein
VTSLPPIVGGGPGPDPSPPPAGNNPSPLPSGERAAPPRGGAGQPEATQTGIQPVAAQKPVFDSSPAVRWINRAIGSPIGPALLVVIAVLPLLIGIWLLALGRTWVGARRRRDAHLRLALATELGLRARSLTDLGTDELMKLRDQVAFDELTGVLRRAAGVAAVEREMSRARRQRSPLCAVFVDVDGLKATNDSQGHAAGDRLLRTVASSLRSGLRGQDLVFRYGGDEFVCVVADTGGQAADDLFVRLKDSAKVQGVGITVGISELRQDDDIVSFLARADEDLYRRRAHSNGRPKTPGLVPLTPRRRRAARVLET